MSSHYSTKRFNDQNVSMIKSVKKIQTVKLNFVINNPPSMPFCHKISLLPKRIHVQFTKAHPISYYRVQKLHNTR